MTVSYFFHISFIIGSLQSPLASQRFIGRVAIVVLVYASVTVGVYLAMTAVCLVFSSKHDEGRNVVPETSFETQYERVSRMCWELSCARCGSSSHQSPQRETPRRQSALSLVFQFLLFVVFQPLFGVWARLAMWISEGNQEGDKETKKKNKAQVAHLVVLECVAIAFPMMLVQLASISDDVPRGIESRPYFENIRLAGVACSAFTVAYAAFTFAHSVSTAAFFGKLLLGCADILMLTMTCTSLTLSAFQDPSTDCTVAGRAVPWLCFDVNGAMVGWQWVSLTKLALSVGVVAALLMYPRVCSSRGNTRGHWEVYPLFLLLFPVFGYAVCTASLSCITLWFNMYYPPDSAFLFRRNEGSKYFSPMVSNGDVESPRVDGSREFPPSSAMEALVACLQTPFYQKTKLQPSSSEIELRGAFLFALLKCVHASQAENSSPEFFRRPPPPSLREVVKAGAVDQDPAHAHLRSPSWAHVGWLFESAFGVLGKQVKQGDLLRREASHKTHFKCASLVVFSLFSALSLAQLVLGSWAFITRVQNGVSSSLELGFLACAAGCMIVGSACLAAGASERVVLNVSMNVAPRSVLKPSVVQLLSNPEFQALVRNLAQLAVPEEGESDLQGRQRAWKALLDALKRRVGPVDAEGRETHSEDGDAECQRSEGVPTPPAAPASSEVAESPAMGCAEASGAAKELDDADISGSQTHNPAQAPETPPREGPQEADDDWDEFPWTDELLMRLGKLCLSSLSSDQRVASVLAAGAEGGTPEDGDSDAAHEAGAAAGRV